MSEPFNGEPRFWLGRLSMSAALALKALREKDHGEACRQLQGTLKEIEASPCPSEELKEHLRSVRK